MADFDAATREWLENDENLQAIINQLKLAASSEVTIVDREPCPKGCGCKHFRNVKVPDYKLKLQIVEFLTNRGVGRPTQAEGESGEKITFIREVRK